jgi:hypothetical protein
MKNEKLKMFKFSIFGFSNFALWAMTDLNRRHPACKAGALDQLS